jgi:hypothetical protein
VPSGNVQSVLVNDNGHRAAGGGVQHVSPFAAIGFNGRPIERLVAAAQYDPLGLAPSHETW